MMTSSIIFIGLIIGFILLSFLFATAPWWGMFKIKKIGKLPVVLGLFLLIFSTTWYFVVGRAAHIFYQEDDVALQQISLLLEDAMPIPEKVRNEINTELDRQEDRVSAQPTVWLLQAQLAMREQDYKKAKKAYGKAHEKYPDDMEISVSYAQAWYLSENQKITPAFRRYLNSLQEQDAEQPGLLNLLAVIAFHQEDYPSAISYWNRLISQYPDDSSEAHTLKAAIQAAHENMTKKHKRENE